MSVVRVLAVGWLLEVARRVAAGAGPGDVSELVLLTGLAVGAAYAAAGHALLRCLDHDARRSATLETA